LIHGFHHPHALCRFARGHQGQILLAGDGADEQQARGGRAEAPVSSTGACGEEHTGLLPAGAAKPLPTPVRDVLLNVEIQFDGSGYLLCYSSTDGTVFGDTWHETLSDAERAATEYFGIDGSEWERAL